MRNRAKLSDFPDVTGYAWGPDVIGQRPQHSVLLMQVIANVSYIENARGHILGSMLGTSAFFALRVYMEIKSRDGKRRALKSIAKDVLSEDEAKLLLEIEKKSQSCIDMRDAFAHGIWATCEQLPDAILRVPADKFLGELFDEKPNPEIFLVGHVHHRDIDVFSTSDLQTIEEESRRALLAYNSFSMLVSIQRQFLHENAEASWRQIGLRHKERIMPGLLGYLKD